MNIFREPIRVNISIAIPLDGSGKQVAIGIGTQQAPPLQMVGQNTLNMAPEMRRMIGFVQVREFVHDHVVEQCGWHVDQPPVQMDAPVRVTGAPLTGSPIKIGRAHV